MDGTITLEGASTSNIFNYDYAGREILMFRGRTSNADGAGINLYGTGDSTDPGIIQFYSGGSSTAARMTLDASGNVGIGTGSPTGGNLEINGGSDYGRIYVRGGGTGYTMADIRLDSSDSFRGAGVYVFNSANDTTWFSGNMYNNADAWGICRNSNVAMSQSTADTGSALVRVSSSGHMTVTNQPSFNAYVSGSAWTMNTTNGVVAFSTTRHNVGSHYSTSTYRFTAPVAGNYFFSYHFFMYTSYDNDTNTYYGFHKNGASHMTTNHGVEGQDGGQAMSAVISLAANDYVTVQMVGGGSISSYGGQYNSFTGHLLG